MFRRESAYMFHVVWEVVRDVATVRLVMRMELITLIAASASGVGMWSCMKSEMWGCMRIVCLTRWAISALLSVQSGSVKHSSVHM